MSWTWRKKKIMEHFFWPYSQVQYGLVGAFNFFIGFISWIWWRDWKFIFPSFSFDCTYLYKKIFFLKKRCYTKNEKNIGLKRACNFFTCLYCLIKMFTLLVLFYYLYLFNYTVLKCSSTLEYFIFKWFNLIKIFINFLLFKNLRRFY